MTLPKVSIIVPIYNVQDYLCKCVKSVLHQTYTDFEILLVDDGSPDHCGEICDDLASTDPRIKVYHKENGGLSSARNYGLDRASGKWIIFLDSDDVWGDRDGLRKLVEYAEKYNLDILRFEYQNINEYGINIYTRPIINKNFTNNVFSNYEMVDKAIAGEWFAVLYLLRKSTLDGIRFNEECKFQEDIDFYCKFFASREMRCGYLPDKIYYYRKREHSLTTTASLSNLKWSFNLCEVFYNQSKKIVDDKFRTLYVYNSVMMYYWTLMTVSENPYYERRKEIIKNLNLEKLQKSTLLRVKQTKISSKHLFFISFPSSIGVKLLRIKNIIVCNLNKLHRILYQ